MDRQGAADFWAKPPPAPAAAHSRIYGRSDAGKENRGAAPQPDDRSVSETEAFLRCVQAVVGGSDAEAAAAARALPAAAANRDIWQPTGDIGHDATRAWFGARPPQNAPQLPRDARARLGLDHNARRRGLAVVPVGGAEFRLPASATPELSRLLATPRNTLLHVAAGRGLAAAVDVLLARGAAPDARNAAGEAPRDVAVSAAARPTAPRAAAAIAETLAAASPAAPASARARPTWTDAWCAVRDAPDEEARAVLVACLGMDGETERGFSVEELRPALTAEDRKNVKMSTDRATGKARARRAAARMTTHQCPDALRLRATRRLQRAFRARHCASNDAEASARAKTHRATASRRVAVVAGDGAARRARDGRRALVARRRLQDREWYDFCGATVGFTLAHLAADRDKPLCLALLLDAGADPDGAAVTAVHRRNEVTPRTLARRNASRRCLAVLGEASVVAPPPPPPPPPPGDPRLGGDAMRAALGPGPPPRAPTPKDAWLRTFDDVRDAPDAQAARAVTSFATTAAGGRWGLDARRLDGYGPDAARTLAHAAAARGKVRTVAALRDAGADLGLRDADGFTCLDLLARAAKTADFQSVAAAVGVEVPLIAPPPPPRDPRLARDRCWQALVDALRNRASEAACLPLAAALAAHGGADAYGRTCWHRPHGDSRTLVAMASERGFRKLLGVLGRAGVAPRGAGELGAPGGGGLVVAR